MPKYDLSTSKAIAQAVQQAKDNASNEPNQGSYNAAWLHGYAAALKDVSEQLTVQKEKVVHDPSMDAISFLIEQVDAQLENQIAGVFGDNNSSFRDIRAKVHFPETYHPDHTLMVWGEENSDEDIFFSVAVYKNNENGIPVETVLEETTESEYIADLNWTIQTTLKSFAARQQIEGQIGFFDRLSAAQQRASGQAQMNIPLPEKDR